MIDKEQQIEELANILDDTKIRALGTIGSLNKGWGMWYATALYNAGYRKVDGDDYVTIEWHNEQIAHAEDEIEGLKAENAKLKCEVNDWWQRYVSRDKQYFELVKTSTECINAKKTMAIHEFAEKLKEKAEPVYGTKNVILTKIIYENTIDELLREYEG